MRQSAGGRARRVSCAELIQVSKLERGIVRTERAFLAGRALFLQRLGAKEPSVYDEGEDERFQ